MSPIPSPMNSHLLEIKVSPAEYWGITAPLKPRTAPPDNYWSILPRYLLARCPLCGSKFTAQLDTYSLKRWHPASSGGSVFDKHHEDTGCQHFVMAHHFLYLGGLLPTETLYLDNNSEVPYVVPCLLSSFIPLGMEQFDTVKPQAVIHALPICQTEGQRFVPTYSVYVIAYYALNAKPLLQRYSQLRPSMERIRKPSPYDADHDLWWDLTYWVRCHKLWWLDANDSSLPLVNAGMEFPYAQIQGVRKGQTYRNGKMTEF